MVSTRLRSLVSPSTSAASLTGTPPRPVGERVLALEFALEFGALVGLLPGLSTQVVVEHPLGVGFGHLAGSLDGRRDLLVGLRLDVLDVRLGEDALVEEEGLEAVDGVAL